jgi:hypothetical protein
MISNMMVVLGGGLVLAMVDLTESGLVMVLRTDAALLRGPVDAGIKR